MSRAIWLASYPKSGNTWMRLALRSLVKGGAQIGLGDIAEFGEVPTTRHMFDAILETDSTHLTQEETEALRPAMHDLRYGVQGTPILCKVHDQWLRTATGRPLFDKNHTHGTIYLVRDPRDVAISWARFSGLSIDGAIDFMAQPRAGLTISKRHITASIAQPLGSWSAHVESWVDQSGLTPHLVRYEDMLGNLAQVLVDVATYLGWPHPPDAVSGAVAATRFDRLADQERRHGFSELPASASRFFVSGFAGGWRTALTSYQVKRIERDHAAVMKRYGYL